MKKSALCTCIVALFACSAFAKTSPNASASATQIVCKDGTSLTVEQRRGACSGHGGIDKVASKDVPQHGGADKVWVNQSTKVYHCPGDVYFGKTKKGEYMSEPEAKSKGFRPDHGKTCAA